ncbi:sodium-dependent transporter bedraggled isoform X2 [Malaya genurostris]|uniref:sodium-dependent transporter bedraggled isoform X2 n=1 Tax=Malaya genurostris TaxID=325434 RepID=UPI0026F3E325|nr:sodium-dependent transporter bedraggled isoform X2 [Malaya genurostris]
MASITDAEVSTAAYVDAVGDVGNLHLYCTIRENKTNGNLNGTANDPSSGNSISSLAARWESIGGSASFRVSHFCTLRGSKPEMGNAIGADVTNGSGGIVGVNFGGGVDAEGELNRNLLYEENMCTFENLRLRTCQRSLERPHEEEEPGCENIENFCTLRKKRPQKSVEQVNGGNEKVQETSLGDQVVNPIGSYCTLKKKKPKFNKKFVESFLEDPNAKLHDYLSELDAYLDEIDGLGLSDHSDENSEEIVSDDDCKVVDTEAEKSKPVAEERCAASSSAINYIDIKNFCTLPKKKRVQFLTNFNRAGPFRQTFVAPSSTFIRRNVIVEADESLPVDRDSAAGGIDSTVFRSRRSVDPDDPITISTLERRPAPRRTFTWLRNSMRKTRPIMMPIQLEPARIDIETTNQNTYNASPVLDKANSSIVQSFVDPFPSRSTVFDHLDLEDHELSSITTLSLSELAELHEPRVVSSINNHEQFQNSTVTHSTDQIALATNSEPIIDGLHPFQTMDQMSPLDVILHNTAEMNRPRQTGRRSEDRPRVVSITAERDTATNQLIIRTNSVPTNTLHPSSCNLSSTLQRTDDGNLIQQHHNNHNNHHQRYREMGSETSSLGSSRNPSPVSLLSTATFSSIASGVETEWSRSRPTEAVRDVTSLAIGTESMPATSTNATETQNGSLNTPTVANSPLEEDSDSSGEESEPEMDRNGRPKPKWPHLLSRSMATSFCALGLFNISRFAVFSIHFGANFIVQFLIFTFLFGIPMLWLQMVLGSRIKGGPVTMWKISPICKGIGIALLIAQGLVSLYTAIALSWVLVYFRDSLVSRSEKYRWQEIFELYRGPGNQSFRLSDTVADYFNGVVLQRYQLGPGVRGINGIGAVRFQLAFNLAIIWTFVFVVLCKGIQSFGKIAIGMFSAAMMGLIAICSKFLSMVNFDSVQTIFPATEWQDFFLNSRSWMSAAQETFLTWGLLGVSVYSISCRTHKGTGPRKTKRELRRDALLVIVFTLSGLMLAALFGSACVQLLNSRGYYYFPGSYENIGTDIFLLPSDQPLPPQHATMPTKWLIRYSMVLGESFKRPYANPHQESGYQAIRLVTELFPSTLAAATQERIAPIWSLIGFLTLLLFGLGQLCAMWKPIAGAIGDSPSSIVLSCVTGLFMGIPLATENGITIIHYLDMVLGGAWWMLLLWIGHILAIFLVRGRPFTSDLLVSDLRFTQSLSAFFAFAWNFLLPIGMIFLCILEYRVSNANAFFNWKHGGYWPLWARQIGGFLQVAFLLLVPIVTIVQIYRYLSRGPPDILDRFDRLLRPPISSYDGSSSNSRLQYTRRPAPPLPVRTINSGSTAISLESRPPQDDAPPKYTPPPSYTTATGARIAKLLRNSIRRSVRRIMGESSSNRQRNTLSHSHQQSQQGSVNPPAEELPPPDYSSVLTESVNQFIHPTMAGIEISPRVLYNSETLSGRRRHRSLNNANTGQQQQNLTATDVLQILRPVTISVPHGPTALSINRTPSFAAAVSSSSVCYGNIDLVVQNNLVRRHSIGSSVENLVLGAAPIGDSSIITLAVDNDNDPCAGPGHAGNDSVI